MKINWPVSGKYVVAVSGGVDSMSLLDMLVNHGKYELIIAHYDHGIRNDSSLDRQLVERAASGYGVKFVTDSGQLGQVSEAIARQHRYDFLIQVQKKFSAMAIITAHHYDDLIETSLLNFARGAGRHGFAPFANRVDVLRPLLEVKKADLLNYAKIHKLSWREDSTNTDTSNPRNFLRHSLLPTASTTWLTEYESIIKQLNQFNPQLDQELRAILPCQLTDLNTLTIELKEAKKLSLPVLESALEQSIRDNWSGLALTRIVVMELAWWCKRASPGECRNFNGFRVKISSLKITIKR